MGHYFKILIRIFQTNGTLIKSQIICDPIKNSFQGLEDENCIKEINDLFLKIPVGNNCSNISISDLENLINRFDRLFHFISKKCSNNFSKDSKSICDNIKKFRGEISSIKQILYKSFIIGNVNNINELYIKIQNNIAELKSEFNTCDYFGKSDVHSLVTKFQNISQVFNQISGIFKNIYKIDDNLSKFLNKIIQYMKNEIDLYRNILNLLDNSEYKLILNSQEQELILNIDQKKNEIKINQIQSIRQAISNIFNEYQQAFDGITSTLSNDKMYDIQYIFKKKIINFIREFPISTDINTSVKTQGKIIKNAILLDLDDYARRLEDFSNKINNRQNTCKLIIQDIFSYALKRNNILDIDNIIYCLHSISKYYEPYVGPQTIASAFRNFLEVFYSENPKIKRPNKTIDETIKEVLEMIQTQPNLHADLPFLVKIFIESIIGHNPFALEILSKLKSSIKSNDQIFLNHDVHLDDRWSSKKCFISKEAQFFVLKHYNGTSNENKKEKSVFNSTISRHVVHTDDNREGDEIVHSFFPMGTLYDMIHRRKIELTDVEKITIIEQIAMGIKDLHGKNVCICALSSQMIYIDSDNNAFIGSLNHNLNHFKSNSVTDELLYYQSPESIQRNATDNQNANDNDGDHVEQMKLGDVYSFGVLMFEVITGKNMKSLMEKNKSKDEIYTILREDYFNYLFSNDDQKSDLLNQFKGVIEKCLKVNQKDRFPNFSKVIDFIGELEICKKYEASISYRISHANDSRTYKCTLSDVIISGYRGNDDCLALINKLLQTVNDTCVNGDCIKSIFTMFRERKPTKHELWTNLFEYSRNHQCQDVADALQQISKSYKLKEGDSLLIQSYNDFLEIGNCQSFEFIHTSLKILLDKFQQEGKYYLIYKLLHSIIENFVGKKPFASNVHEKLKEMHLRDNELLPPGNIDIFNNRCSSYVLHCDNELNFYMKIDYIKGFSKKEIEREIRILLSNYSKYIAHLVKNNFIQYFPIGPLKRLICGQSGIRLTFVDKYVISIEIAIALKDLHDNGEYHGQLSSQRIFVDCHFDSYICSFCRTIDVDINDAKALDIKSYGMLLHEIFSNASSSSHCQTRKEKVENQNQFFDFLSHSKSSNESFDYEPILNICKKCCKADDNERYSRMDDVIEDLKKTSFYKENKEEIEYRLSNSIDGRDYKCTLSDVVSSFYQGQPKCRADLQSALKMDFEGDLMQSLFDIFGFDCHDLFDYFVQKEIDHDNNKLIRQIKEEIEKYPNDKGSNYQALNEFVCDKSAAFVCTLNDFIKNNIVDIPIEWVHRIASELNYMHSLGIYHGELLMKTIAVLYDIKKQTLSPSIISFYSFFNDDEYQQYFSHEEKLKLKKLKSKMYREEDAVEKMIQIDIKAFIKIFDVIPNVDMRQYASYDSMNIITYELSKSIEKHQK